MKREELKLKIGVPLALRIVIYRRTVSKDPGINPLKQGIIEGDNPVFAPVFLAYDVRSKSRVVWECSSKWVVRFI